MTKKNNVSSHVAFVRACHFDVLTASLVRQLDCLRLLGRLKRSFKDELNNAGREAKQKRERDRGIRSCYAGWTTLYRYYANGLICKHLRMLLHAIRHYEMRGERFLLCKRTRPGWIERATRALLFKCRKTRCVIVHRIQYWIKLYQF